ncbi:hypothetical protein [Serratia marcescens]|uniref:hypothetical protein n=1 Tax=Serratia marcescens TaxID=615 RepID=UPI00287509E7|nr:hypothetical protein [Serratia marcescens]MDS0826050.1 hypothetical protein [Serratia marcescens]
MSNPFYAAANLVLALHTERAKYTKPQYATSEVNWLAGKLQDLAGVAKCVGDDNAGFAIDRAASTWVNTGRKPAPFPTGDSNVQFY